MSELADLCVSETDSLSCTNSSEERGKELETLFRVYCRDCVSFVHAF